MCHQHLHCQSHLHHLFDLWNQNIFILLYYLCDDKLVKWHRPCHNYSFNWFNTLVSFPPEGSSPPLISFLSHHLGVILVDTNPLTKLYRNSLNDLKCEMVSGQDCHIVIIFTSWHSSKVTSTQSSIGSRYGTIFSISLHSLETCRSRR